MSTGLKKAKIVRLDVRELAGVDAGAQEAQGTVVLKHKLEMPQKLVATSKRSALTTPVLGHTHLICGLDDHMAGTTSYESTYEDGRPRDYYSGHAHPWVRGEDGTIAVGEAMGHTHEVGTMTSAVEKQAVPKSTPSKGPVIVETTKAQEPIPMTTPNLSIVVLSEAQHAHYSKLTPTEQTAFAAKSSLERDAEVQKARDADPIVFTGEVTKMTVRKSDGERVRELAEANEANAVEAKKARELAESEKAKRELAELTKRANDTIGNLAGETSAHVALLHAAEGIADEKQRDAAIATLKSANDAMRAAGKAKGANPGNDPEPQDAAEEYEAGVTKFAEKNGIKDRLEANEKFLGTVEGQALKRKYDATRAYGKHLA